MRKRSMAVILAILAFGLVAASAATMTVTSTGTVGAGVDAVAACDTDGVDVTYTVSGRNVTGVIVSGIATTCNGKNISVALADAAGTGLGSASDTLPGGATADFSHTLGGLSVDAEALVEVAVVISG